MLNQNLYLEKIQEIESSIVEKKFSSAHFSCNKILEKNIYPDVEKVYIFLGRIYFTFKDNKYLKKEFLILKCMVASSILARDSIKEIYFLIYELFGNYENAFDKINSIQNLGFLQFFKKDELKFNASLVAGNSMLNFYNFQFFKNNNVLTTVFSLIEAKVKDDGFFKLDNNDALIQKILPNLSTYGYDFKNLLLS